MDEQGMLADPAIAGALCPVALEYGCGIDKYAAVDFAYLVANESEQVFELALDNKMIVFAVGVAADFGRQRILLSFFRLVVVEEADDGTGTRDEGGRIDAFVEMVFHPLHAAVHPLIEPMLKPASFLIHTLGLSDARERESQPGCFFLDEPAVCLFPGIGSG